MFRNYFRNPRSASPASFGIIRLIIALYLSAKIVSVSWDRIAEFPVLFPRTEPLLVSPLVAHAGILQWVAVGLLALFAVGIYIRAVAFGLSVLVCYFGELISTVNGSGLAQSFFLWSILLLLYGLYAEQDVFSADGIRRRSRGGVESLNDHLKSPLTPIYNHTALAAFLLAFASVYFGSGIAKVVVGGPGWISALNLGRYIHPPNGLVPGVAELLLQSEPLLVLGTIGALVLEGGFIFTVVSGVFFPVFVVSLILFHISIMVIMGPIFTDFIVFLLLFANWNGAISRLESEISAEVVYDEQCTRCATALYLFKFLDVNESVYFYSQSDVPDEYADLPGVDVGETTYLFKDGKTYRGYHAIRKLCNHLGVLRPVGFIMGVSAIESVGGWLYRYLTLEKSQSVGSVSND